MSEIPKMRLQLPDGEFEATPENASLFTFVGHYACYSHVFLQTAEDDSPTGSFLFANSPVFQDMFDFMLEQGYPAHLNMREVPDCDRNAFDQMVAQQMADTDQIPEEWLS